MKCLVYKPPQNASVLKSILLIVFQAKSLLMKEELNRF